MRKIQAALGLVAATTLCTELLLTRVFDVILYPNIGYMIITGAMFAFGLAGIYATLRPVDPDVPPERRLTLLCLGLAVTLLAIRPALNAIPFEYTGIATQPLRQAIYFLAMYLVITVPFFLAGLVFTIVFSSYARHIQRLYFWDLAGAAIGCLILIPLLRPLGPGGILWIMGSLACVAAWLLAPVARLRNIAAAGAAACALLTLTAAFGYLDFREHKSDRGLREARAEGRSETVVWDPVSKVEVIDVGPSKNIVYDGGSQSSFIYAFDGDLESLRRQLDRAVRLNREDIVLRHFWQRGVLASHWLARDSDQEVLVIGSAAGQEVKAALTYGAGHVDGIEMVSAVVELGKDRYADYNGGVLEHPNADVRVGEGRTFVRSTDRRYDIIQIFSNHSSSSVAAGSGAMDPTYLLTADAFAEYFDHLADDGMLHINHHVYPRIVTTAALAWRNAGREDFQRHVMIVAREADPFDTLPTILINMRPWTQPQVRRVRSFFSIDAERPVFKVMENPLEPAASFLTPEFYSGELSPELIERVPYRIVPTTDDRPYFKYLRRTWGEIDPSTETFVRSPIAYVLNRHHERGGGIPLDVIHLVVSAVVSLLFAGVFILVPLVFSETGRAPWRGKAATLLYFSCLGAGFILIELVLIQKFMRFIGYPLYTYTLVLFTVLLAAGCGSLASGWLGISPDRRWTWPFLGVLGYGALFSFTHVPFFEAFLPLGALPRMLLAAIYIFPLGFFLGMPFPLGILAIEQRARGAVAWAWAMNGLFTVTGGLASVLLSIYLGFTVSQLIGLAIYAVALAAFARIRALAPA